MTRLRIAVLMGGPSPERDVSMSTGREIVAALDPLQYDVLPVEITKEGWKAAQNSGEYLVEHRIRRASDGEYRWHQTRARPIGGAGGMTNDWVGTMTDFAHLPDFLVSQVKAASFAVLSAAREAP